MGFQAIQLLPAIQTQRAFQEAAQSNGWGPGEEAGFVKELVFCLTPDEMTKKILGRFGRTKGFKNDFDLIEFISSKFMIYADSVIQLLQGNHPIQILRKTIEDSHIEKIDLNKIEGTTDQKKVKKLLAHEPFKKLLDKLATTGVRDLKSIQAYFEILSSRPISYGDFEQKLLFSDLLSKDFILGEFLSRVFTGVSYLSLLNASSSRITNYKFHATSDIRIHLDFLESVPKLASTLASYGNLPSGFLKQIPEVFERLKQGDTLPVVIQSLSLDCDETLFEFGKLIEFSAANSAEFLRLFGAVPAIDRTFDEPTDKNKFLCGQTNVYEDIVMNKNAPLKVRLYALGFLCDQNKIDRTHFVMATRSLEREAKLYVRSSGRNPFHMESYLRWLGEDIDVEDRDMMLNDQLKVDCIAAILTGLPNEYFTERDIHFLFNTIKLVMKHAAIRFERNVQTNANTAFNFSIDLSDIPHPVVHFSSIYHEIEHNNLVLKYGIEATQPSEHVLVELLCYIKEFMQVYRNIDNDPRWIRHLLNLIKEDIYYRDLPETVPDFAEDHHTRAFDLLNDITKMWACLSFSSSFYLGVIQANYQIYLRDLKSSRSSFN